MTQLAVCLVTSKNVLSDAGQKAVTSTLGKTSNVDYSLEKTKRKVGEKTWFAQGKPEQKVSQALKDLTTKVRSAVEGDLKDAELKEYLNTPFSLNVGDRPHLFKW
mmetsp:Transcript_95672/g.206422  ORF Transcript_95672/g.206422 Transcript_95672/m.206422 type:complete len:105 (+) Transcript_95672:221-535(+)|eukprot:CAMPEP_0116907504 /NCGR_PEP_ID=MMETSP0467-20121206/13150_1 /TAXON_ID=283647 /ORGANISM="Mesodinium pulex, Strain SPMC105" /LENGTH=104 /DNA_ID=CAMNT_0004582545 /DNA_START=217 /DNA_END=528 /DNA_ORIENTATION=+